LKQPVKATADAIRAARGRPKPQDIGSSASIHRRFRQLCGDVATVPSTPPCPSRPFRHRHAPRNGIRTDADARRIIGFEFNFRWNGMLSAPRSIPR